MQAFFRSFFDFFLGAGIRREFRKILWKNRLFGGKETEGNAIPLCALEKLRKQSGLDFRSFLVAYAFGGEGINWRLLARSTKATNPSA